MTLLQFWPHYLRGLGQIAAIALGSGVCALALAAVAAGVVYARRRGERDGYSAGAKVSGGKMENRKMDNQFYA
jgi:hypothetical protein